MTRVLLIRHPQIGSNPYLPIAQDHLDTGLSESAIASAQQLKRRLLSEPTPDIVMASPLKRALETCAILFPDTTLRILAGFSEIDKGFPSWIQGHPDGAQLTTKQWDEQFNAEPDLQKKLRFTYPSGMSVEVFMEHVWNDFLAVFDSCQNSNLAIVSHNGPIKSILAMCQGDPTLYYRLSIDYAKYAIIENNRGTWSIAAINK